MTSTLEMPRSVGHLFTESVLATRSAGQFEPWWSERARSNRFNVTPIAFDDLGSWHFDPDTGNLAHASGKFFTIEGLHVRSSYGPVGEWSQPVINQPEIGILGIIVKNVDGVPHCLMQAKMEPGNVNTLQLSPTVQATRSNYTRVHQGGSTRYLEYFAGPVRGRVLVDVLQSEQGRPHGAVVHAVRPATGRQRVTPRPRGVPPCAGPLPGPVRRRPARPR
jgi:oxidase EvaA